MNIEDRMNIEDWKNIEWLVRLRTGMLARAIKVGKLKDFYISIKRELDHIEKRIASLEENNW